nr:PREDICTED: uncharacterized protein LOC109451675 [Rhinolophus sinicus]
MFKGRRRWMSQLNQRDFKVMSLSLQIFTVFLHRVQEQYQETCSFLRAATTIISDTLNCYFLVFITSGHCQIIAQMNYEEISVCACVMKTGPSTLKNFHPVLPPGGTLDVSGINLRTSAVSSKISFSAARKKTLNTKKIPLQLDLQTTSGHSSATKQDRKYDGQKIVVERKSYFKQFQELQLGGSFSDCFSERMQPLACTVFRTARGDCGVMCKPGILGAAPQSEQLIV